MPNPTNVLNLLGDIVPQLRNTREEQLLVLHPDDIIILDNQIRSSIDESSASFLELCDSVDDKGVLTPILVRLMDDDRLILCAGERRLRSARKTHKTKIPCLVKVMTDEEFEDYQFAENLHRENLMELDQARRVKRDYEKLGSKEAVATKHNKSLAWVSQLLSASNPGNAALKAIHDGVSTQVDVVAGLNAIEKRHGSEAALNVVEKIKEAKKEDPEVKPRDVVRDASRDLKPPKPKDFSKRIVDFIYGKAPKGTVKVAGLWLQEQSETDPEKFAELEAQLRTLYLAGRDCKKPSEIVSFFAHAENASVGIGLLRSFAFSYGLESEEFSLENVLQSALDHVQK